jgi:hypothetical protein
MVQRETKTRDAGGLTMKNAKDPADTPAEKLRLELDLELIADLDVPDGDPIHGGGRGQPVSGIVGRSSSGGSIAGSIGG